MIGNNNSESFEKSYVEIFTAYVFGGGIGACLLFFAWWFTGRCGPNQNTKSKEKRAK